MKCLLPNAGEFGWFLMYHIKFFHTLKGPKIAVCKENEELFFPSADGFVHHDFDRKDEDRNGSMNLWKDDRIAIIEKIGKKYPGCELLQPKCKGAKPYAMELANIKVPFTPKKVGAKVDVVITPRFRKICPERNYKYWSTVVKKLKAAGLTVGAIGLRNPLTDKLNLDLRSWDHIENHTDVEMLQNCKLCICVNSGGGLLSLFCDAPTLMLHPAGAIGNHDLLHSVVTNHNNVFEYNESIWNQPNMVVKKALKMISSSMNL